MPLSGPDVVLYEKRGHVAIITMNRPERMNALGGGLPQRLQEHWQTVNADDEVWVAILTGTGRAFSAGADLKERHERGVPDDASNPVLRGATPWAPVPTWKPTIAAINGYCVAGGFGVAMTCDVRLAAASAQFAITEVKVNGLFPGRLEYFPTIGIACELLMWGQYLTAQRMAEIGFVNKVVPDDQLLDEALRWAELVCDNAPASVRATKHWVYLSQGMSDYQQIQFRNALFRPLTQMEDFREGPRAFVERRKPQWNLR
ncbi:MAG: enoyl-CoA hydratase/isomerase family protein [Chloroflexi bacterium]|nr:enoyl-CoA hydratase/isomerase family protein [Chloroflexota bacterium]